MLYDDYMICDNIKMKRSYIAKDVLKCVEMKYHVSNDDKFGYLYDKVLTVHQKLSMMMFAEFNLHKEKENFESTQNMDIPTLYGMGKTIILFYFESMLLFARNALDVAATVYSDLMFDKRTDSFNELSKWIIKSGDMLLEDLKQYLVSSRGNGLSAFRLLCGSQRGRALRDIIVHQANVKLEYYEYKDNCEKEHLFLLLKDMEPIDFDWFVSGFIDDIEKLFNITTLCCQKYLEKKMQQ